MCNLQLTNDGGAFCVTGATLDNSTTIEMFDPKQKTYNINGRDVQGHFSTDYSGVQIENDVKSESYINLHSLHCIFLLGHLVIQTWMEPEK